MISYISTRGHGVCNFEDVLLNGLAPDGGLYVPNQWPTLDLPSLKGKTYTQIAYAVMYPFVEGVIPSDDFECIINETYASAIFRHKDVVPLHKLDKDIYILEQFYGPTIAFKDIALQLLGRLFDYVLTKRHEKVTIVGATSGDTGSAAIEGCRGSDNIRMFILFPHGRVSDVQRRQMTTIHDENICNIALDGTFDDCQNMVKTMFNDRDFNDEMNLSAVNSINWARIMAQIVYYVTSALALGAPQKELTYIVPTGNFGNVFAAYCARQMGLPIRLIVATNENDILARFFQSGEMRARGVEQTISPSMDIEISSNFERYLFDLFDRDSVRVHETMRIFKKTNKFILPDDLMARARKDFDAMRVDEGQVLETIGNVYRQHGYILDPHTAIGVKVALDLAHKNDGHIVALATAHPAKFPDAVKKATGAHPDLPPHLKDLFEREERFETRGNDVQSMQDFMRTYF